VTRGFTTAHRISAKDFGWFTGIPMGRPGHYAFRVESKSS